MNTNLTEVKNSLAKKLFVNFFIICAIVGIILTSFSYYRSKQYVWNVFSRITTSCAISVSHMLHDAPIDDYIHHKQMKSYNYYYEILKDFASSFGLKYLYVYIPDIKNNRLIPVFGVVGETGEPIENFSLGDIPENLKLNDEVIRMYATDEQKLTLEMNNEFGHVLTGYSKILDKHDNPIAIVGADIEFSYIVKKLIKDCAIFFISIFFALLILYILGIFYIRKTFIDPILQLSTEMTKYFHHDVYDATPITLNTDDELNIIASLYNNMAAEKKRIENELDIAQKIQISALPRIFPPYPDRKEFDIFANMTTAKEVGGDFYDFFFIDKNNFAFLIADVCGKGVPAALFMMEVKSVLKNTLKSGVSIDEAISEANREICENNKQNFFATAFIAVVDILTGDISYVNAGHNLPLLKRIDGTFEYLETEQNLVLGIMNGFEYKKTQNKLNKGDMLFLYTDGVTEAMDDNSALYGEERLKNVLNKNSDIKLDEIITELEKDIKIHSQNTEQSDDITTLIFKYNG